ncbi:hypothetical protein BN14_11211 [Rhizoctonia solani AG-1 IB]|uniref:Uncharacterized protein n=2 Tax=Rhizoctonia solani TaxID=456999 RepID=A0A8H3AQ60_9AGAM|nr:unnamed protein product [Rhizoctonia solani]CCO37060.1 hypothetical protein BN14_11211 [Rhizoctonia solani AG-1 IB]
MGRSIEHNVTLYNTLERLRDGHDRDTNPSCITASLLLIRTLRHLRVLIDEGAGPAELLNYIIEVTNYYEYLVKRSEDRHSWYANNVQQTIRYAKLFKGNKRLGSLPVYLFLDFMKDLSRINDFNTGLELWTACIRTLDQMASAKMKNDDFFTSPSLELRVYST